MPSSKVLNNLMINKLTEAQYDAAVQGGTISEDDLSLLIDAEDKAVQVDTMPTASASEVGNIYQYVGTTDANYTNGYFYKCDGAPGGARITGEQSVGATNFTVVNQTQFDYYCSELGYGDFTGAILRYSSVTGYWGWFGSIGGEAPIPDSDLTQELGITYTGTPQDNDEVELAYTSGGGYSWTRVDVQPAPVIPDPLPSQTGQSGKFLTTDGTDASWSDKPLVNKAISTGLCISPNTNSVSNSNGIVISTGSGAMVSAVGSVAISTSGRASGLGAICVGAFDATGTHSIQLGSTGTTTSNSDPNTFKVANANGNYEIMSADGTIPADRLTHAINKYSTMPIAASTNEGWIVQYTGTTDSTYTHGYIYECVSDGADPATYSWSAIQVQAGASGSYLPLTGGTMTGAIELPGHTRGDAKLYFGDTNRRKIFAQDSTSIMIEPETNNDIFGSFLFKFGGSWSGSAGSLSVLNNRQPYTLGTDSYPWNTTYTLNINCGAGGEAISVPKVGGNVAIQSDTVPTPSADRVGFIYQYTGEDGAGLTAGYFYKCIVASPESATATQTTGSSLSDITVDAETFISASGLGTHTYQYDGTNWKTVGDVQLVVYMNSLGITYTGTPVSGDEITVVATGASYTWEQTDVQPSSTSATATLAVNDWSSNTQTVNVTGVTANNNVIVAPAPASQVDYTNAGIICTAQGAGTLTFTCTSVPSSAITVNVLII